MTGWRRPRSERQYLAVSAAVIAVVMSLLVIPNYVGPWWLSLLAPPTAVTWGAWSLAWTWELNATEETAP